MNADRNSLKNVFSEEDYPPIQIPPRGKLPLDSKQMALLEDILPNSELTGQESGKIYGDKLEVQMSSVLHPDNFDNKNKHLSKDPVTNPANYYLHGANLDKVGRSLDKSVKKISQHLA